MHGNGKIIPVETIPGMGERGIKENSGLGKCNILYMMHCMNFCKCHKINK
jgi:hypothetical protein